MAPTPKSPKAKTVRQARIHLAGCEAEYRQALAEAEQLRQARDAAIVDAVALGVSGAEIANVLGVTVGRVSQLLVSTRESRTTR